MGLNYEPSPRLREVGNTLAAASATKSLIRVLGDEGVSYMLLKGPVIVDWLYASDPSLRPYSDVDLLVSPDHWDRAKAIVGRLGFTPPPPRDPADWELHAETWQRETDGAVVDLHRNLPFLEASPDRTWALLFDSAARFDLDDMRVLTPSDPAKAMHLALHALQHRSGRVPRRDLHRALDQLDVDVWREAAAIAAELGGVDAFVAGLLTVPEADALLASLHLTSRGLPMSRLAEREFPPVALTLTRAHELPWSQRPLFLLRKMIPSPDFLRAWTPLARKGPAGLIAAYIWRVVWVVIHLPSGWRAARSARRVD